MQLWSKAIDALTGSFLQFGVRDIIDILLVAVVMYQLILLTKETRAAQVIKGLLAIVVGQILASTFQLNTIAFLLDQTLRAGSIALVVIFQPELRRALEKLGRGAAFARRDEDTDVERMARACATAIANLSEREIGALMVFEGQTLLGDIIATGTRLDAAISPALIEQIFEPNTPLHDGATILQRNSIVSAGCFLPLSDNQEISRLLGTRHRAALGVSEISDCLAFVVSEETGIVSLVRNGALEREIGSEAIVEAIVAFYQTESGPRSWLYRLFMKGD